MITLIEYFDIPFSSILCILLRETATELTALVNISYPFLSQPKAERADEKLQRKTTVRMGIRVIQHTMRPPLPATTVYSVPVSESPSAESRSQPCKTRVTFAENEIIEDEGKLASIPRISLFLFQRMLR